MEELIRKYENKLVAQGLALPGEVVLGGLETEIMWNSKHESTPVLESVFQSLNINSLLFAPPAEPYKSMLDFLAKHSQGTIYLKDNETRTFLHDIPVIRNFNAPDIVKQLKRRKCVIVQDRGIVTWGTVTPEQAFVNYSSVCFSCFVKFFADYLLARQAKQISGEWQDAFDRAVASLSPFPDIAGDLGKGPFKSEEGVYEAIAEVGRRVVNCGFVDSFMGNISYCFDNTLYISQTGSSLDELEGCIDPCPTDNSSCAGITASSELPAHLRIIKGSSYTNIVHGHPKFAVIMSLICPKKGCEFEGRCHIRCPEPRHLNDIPIVPGESGTGPHALCNTVPPAIEGNRGVIVYGHGVFAAGNDDFNTAFQNLASIEKTSREEFFLRVKGA